MRLIHCEDSLKDLNRYLAKSSSIIHIAKVGYMTYDVIYILLTAVYRALMLKYKKVTNKYRAEEGKGSTKCIGNFIRLKKWNMRRFGT